MSRRRKILSVIFLSNTISISIHFKLKRHEILKWSESNVLLTEKRAAGNMNAVWFNSSPCPTPLAPRPLSTPYRHASDLRNHCSVMSPQTCSDCLGRAHPQAPFLTRLHPSNYLHHSRSTSRPSSGQNHTSALVDSWLMKLAAGGGTLEKHTQMSQIVSVRYIEFC